MFHCWNGHWTEFFPVRQVSLYTYVTIYGNTINSDSSCVTALANSEVLAVKITAYKL